jgi:murein DD-endopeptidase MepM/ murein hydrolase activator NlpD
LFYQSSKISDFFSRKLFVFSLIVVSSAFSTFSFASTSKNLVTDTILNNTELQMGDKWISYRLSQGDNLSSAFVSVGLSVADAILIDKTFSDSKQFSKLFPNEQLDFLIENKQLSALKYTNKKNVSILISKQSATDIFKIIKQDLDVTQNTTQSKPILNTEQLNKQIIDESHIQVAVETFLTKNSASNSPNALDLLINQDHSDLDEFIYYNVQANDTLSLLLVRAGLSHVDAINISNAQEASIFKSLQIGQRFGVLIRKGHLIQLEYQVSKLKTLIFTRTSRSGYAMRSLEKKPIEKLKFAQGIINSSFFIDALNAGLTDNEAMNFTIPFRWDVDFSQDIQPGDAFKVVYQNNTIDGETINTGKVLVAQLTTQGKAHTGILFTTSDGESSYYTPEGRLMRKTFLRMPIELARISSKFNPRRRHPISKKIRAHNGVDYAAKSGTPIMAAGSGKITHIGWKGDYGRTVIIKHDAGTTTLYAHMSGFNKELKLGSKVTQKQVIGYVGASGAVTGAHLHYEFRVNGVHKNPLTVKLPKASILAPEELQAFKRVANSAMKKLHSYNQELVKNDTTSTNI